MSHPDPSRFVNGGGKEPQFEFPESEFPPAISSNVFRDILLLSSAQDRTRGRLKTVNLIGLWNIE